MPISENKIRQINTHSEYFQDILEKVPSSIFTIGNTAVLFLFLLISLGMKLIKYPDVIDADVLVTTETPPIEMYSRVSGRIMALLRRDQQHVNNGDWILVINNSADYKDVLTVNDYLKKINTINFWTAINSIPKDESIHLGDLQDSYIQLSKSVGELKLFQQLQSHNLQLAINSRQQKNLIYLKQHLYSQLEIQGKEIALTKSDYNRNLKLDSEKVITPADLEQKEIAYLTTKNNLEQINSNLINTEVQSEVLKKENVTLSVDLNNTYFNLRRNIIQHYNNFLFQLLEWKNKYILEAPVDGIVNLYEVRNENQFITTEQKILTITPTTHKIYFAIVKLPIANSGKVRVGQKCLIKLNNYPYTEFGFLNGNVTSISSAAKEGFYSVKVSLTRQLITSLNKRLDAKSELFGQANIVVEDLTLFDRLFNSLINKNY